MRNVLTVTSFCSASPLWGACVVFPAHEGAGLRVCGGEGRHA